MARTRHFLFIVGAFTAVFVCLLDRGAHAQRPIEAAAVTQDAKQHSLPVSRLPPVIPAGRPSIGIVFEGGGALGLAHVGVMDWMAEHHIPVDRIAGTSMGALVGSFFAAGYTPQQVEALAKSNVLAALFTTQPLLSHASLRRREDRQDMPHALTLGLKGGAISGGNNLITDDQLNALLGSKLSAYNTDVLNFDDLPIPFRCVSSNLSTLTPYTFNSGSLPLSVRASISIPGVFAPVEVGHDILVDGAITDNLPTDVMIRDLHPDVVISVYLGDASFSEKDATSLANVIERALSAGTSRNVALARPLADIELAPDVTKYSVTDYDKADVLIRAGYDAAEHERDRLLKYQLSDDAWTKYEADLASRIRPAPQHINSVRVEGPDRKISIHLEEEADRLADKPFQDAAANEVVSDIRGEGTLGAYYETFLTHSSQGPNAEHPVAVPPDDGLVIKWRPNGDGPPYLLINTDVAAMSANVTSADLHLRFIDQNLGSYGSELRTDAEVGYRTDLNTEYYLPFASSHFYFQPRLLYRRQPVYYWESQKRVSERLLQNAGGGADLGFVLGRNFQAAVEYQNEMVRWVLKDGTDDSPTQHLSGTTQSIAAHIFLTNRSAEVAAPTGGQFDLTVGRLLHTADSPEAPFANLRARHSFSFGPANSVIVSADVNTYFRNNVADPFRFTLGGPLHLSASSVDEFRGTDTVLVQSVYLHRIANLPTGLGHGLYIAGGYEAGSVWSPERTAILRQDGFTGVLLNTPVGVLTFGGAVGDAGHRKVFFTLGRVF
jgi:NTE family protein